MVYFFWQNSLLVYYFVICGQIIVIYAKHLVYSTIFVSIVNGKRNYFFQNFKCLKVSLKQKLSHHTWIKSKIYFKYNISDKCKLSFYIKLKNLSTTQLTYDFSNFMWNKSVYKEIYDVKKSKKLNWITKYFYNFSLVISHNILKKKKKNLSQNFFKKLFTFLIKKKKKKP